MGSAVTAQRYARHWNISYKHPIVFCREIRGITDCAVPMNVAISKVLLDVPAPMRSARLESCLVSALSDLPEPLVIRDIDVLFSPSYQVDVLRLLCDAQRKHRFDLVWHGRFQENRLLYAEEGYADYRAFDIDRYDITCVY